MFINVGKKWQFVLEICMVVLGTIIMGFAFSVFLEPNEISTGGFSALSMVINVLLSKIGLTNIPTSAIYFVLNIGLYFLALKTLGKKFAIKALIGIISFSLSMQLFEALHLGLSYEILISAVYGGVIMGIGVGLVVRFGGSTGGTDMIASILKKKRPTATFGTLIICIDFAIILLTLFVFPNGLELLPYTILALTLCMFITDFVNEGYKQIKAYNIITTKPEELSNAILNNLSRGCSCTQIKGMHSHSDKCIVICLISRFQTAQLKSIIKEIDPSAFVYATKVSEVIGEWSSFEEIQNSTPPTIKKSVSKKQKLEIQKIISTDKLEVQQTNQPANHKACCHKTSDPAQTKEN